MSVPSLTSLLKQSHVADHDEILKAANKALQSDKNDIKAQHVKVVALLKLDRFQDAVRAIETGDKSLKELAKLEHAYALYKSGKRPEAADLARDSSNRGLKHVEAQALYGNENFERASDLYKLLSNDPQEDAVADLRINVLAVNAQLEWNNLGQYVESSVMTREDFEAHEAVYNMACISIARGELGQCEVLLKRAKQLLENMQDMSDEEKENELLPTNIQHIFVLTRLGRHDEAQELASQLDLARISEPVTNHIARVNTEAAKRSTANPFLLQRQLDVDLDAFEPGVAFNFQTAAFMRNQYALDLGAMKFDGTATSTQALLAKQEDSATTSAKINTVSVINAAAHSKNQTGKAGLKFILPLLEKRPNDVGLLLTIVQLHVLNNNTPAALALFETFLSRLEQSADDTRHTRYAPGVIATVVSLNRSLGRNEEARSQLAKAATFWRDRAPEELTPGVVHLLKAAGSALLDATTAGQQGDDDEVNGEAARAIFELLLARDARDKYAAAGLVAASSTTETASDVSSLANFEKLTANVDADALERSGIAQRRTSADVAQTDIAKKRSAPTEIKERRNKKIRQSKMPKDYDPSKTPDPERWLPLRDRSTYKPKGKKNKAKQAMLSQGAVNVESNVNQTTTTSTADVVKAKSAPGGNSNTSNKKKKPKKK